MAGHSYDRRAADVKRLDLSWVEGLRKDFLTLLKNLPRIHDYKTAMQLDDAVRIYRNNFESLFFEHFLNHDWKYNHEDIEEGTRKWYDRELRGPAWSFMVELSVPISRADDYYTEAERYAEFQRKAPAWKAKVQRRAQVFWKAMKDFLDSMATNLQKPAIDVKVPSIDKTVLEGFQLVMKGFEPDNEYNQEELAILKDGLRLYRKQAATVAPILLKKQLPIVVEFKATLDKGGQYNHNGTIEFFASSMLSKGPAWVAHVMAHEMGHHLFRTYLSKEAQTFWYETIQGDFGELDLRELLNKWPGDTWAFDFPRVMGDSDPILALQVAAISQEQERYQTKEDFQKLLDEGKTTVRVPKTPITGYANKNPEEAFCETLGLLVGYGPAAVHPRVRWWLETAMPGAVKVAYTYARPV
jgi:hypothetical protein